MNVGCLGLGRWGQLFVDRGRWEGRNGGKEGRAGGKGTRWRRNLELIFFLVRSVQSMEAHSMAVEQHHLLRA
jgi:hypothetical protein